MEQSLPDLNNSITPTDVKRLEQLASVEAREQIKQLFDPSHNMKERIYNDFVRKIVPGVLKEWINRPRVKSASELSYWIENTTRKFVFEYWQEYGYDERIVRRTAESILRDLIEGEERKSIFSVRIAEEPLTAQNLTTIISALMDLSTKYWLIAKGRFADLIEYTQTHNSRFAEEANVVVTRITYNSPMNMDWKVDLSAPSVAEALVTTIDGITQRQVRLEKAKLETQAKALEIKESEQKSEQENQMALLEQEKQRLELEQRRLEVLEKQLEVQKKGIEYALEIAGKVVDTLHPGSDQATRAMEIQALLPNLIQLQNVKGLELVLPTTPSKAE